MSIEALRAKTGFTLLPLQVGPNDDAFLGFVAFAFGKSEEAMRLMDKFISEGGLLEVRSQGDIPAAAGRYIDWLIENQWGEESATTAPAAIKSAANEKVGV